MPICFVILYWRVEGYKVMTYFDFLILSTHRHVCFQFWNRGISCKNNWQCIFECVLKATAGGGGRGMRLAKEPEEFVKLLQVLSILLFFVWYSFCLCTQLVTIEMPVVWVPSIHTHPDTYIIYHICILLSVHRRTVGKNVLKYTETLYLIVHVKYGKI